MGSRYDVVTIRRRGRPTSRLPLDNKEGSKLASEVRNDVGKPSNVDEEVAKKEEREGNDDDETIASEEDTDAPEVGPGASGVGDNNESPRDSTEEIRRDEAAAI